MSEHSLSDMQVNLVAARFGVMRSHARVIAENAFGVGGDHE
jgi:hypothetical protein